jgi:undecaprenyl-diphosphatase
MVARLEGWWRSAGRDAPFLAAGAIVFFVAVWIEVEMADDDVPGDYLPLEARILRAFRHSDDLARGLGPPWVESVVRDITAVGSVAVLTLLVVLVLGFLLLRRRRRAALLIFLATVGGVAVSDTIKVIAHRDRPQIVPHLMAETSLSFPSGHSMMSSVVYLTLGALLGQTLARRREKIYLIAAAILVSFIVGVSRIYLGVHYPTDVVAGWAAGVAWALLFWGLAWWLQRRGQLRTPEESPPGDAATEALFTAPAADRSARAAGAPRSPPRP